MCFYFVQCIYNGFAANGGYQIGAFCSPYTQGNNCGQNVQAFDVRTVTVHPQYNGNSQINDFALVRLSGTSSITPVAMDQLNISSSYASGKRVWPIGKYPVGFLIPVLVDLQTN